MASRDVGFPSVGDWRGRLQFRIAHGDDLTVEADAVLALETISITVRAPGKSDLHFDRPAAAAVLTNIVVSDLRDGTVVNMEASGIKSRETIVIARAQVALVSGKRVAVTIRLAADCTGALSLTCGMLETCERGICVLIPSPRDAGMPGADGAVTDLSADIPNSNGGAGGSGSAAGGAPGGAPGGSGEGTGGGALGGSGGGAGLSSGIRDL